MGAGAPKPPLAIPPHSKLWGFLTFSHELSSRERAPPLIHKGVYNDRYSDLGTS